MSRECSSAARPAQAKRAKMDRNVLQHLCLSYCLPDLGVCTIRISRWTQCCSAATKCATSKYSSTQSSTRRSALDGLAEPSCCCNLRQKAGWLCRDARTQTPDIVRRWSSRNRTSITQAVFRQVSSDVESPAPHCTVAYAGCLLLRRHVRKTPIANAALLSP